MGSNCCGSPLHPIRKRVDTGSRGLNKIDIKSGLSIAFIGTDGSGKSTIIQQVTPWLEGQGYGDVNYEHLRPNWLSALGEAAGKREKGDCSPVTDPHAQKTSGFLGSLVRLGYYWLDYSLGFWIKTRPLIRKKGKVCVFDRYFYDFIIDPRRMRIQLPLWVLRSAFFFVAKPDLVICLGADPAVLYARKPETSLEEVSRQVLELKQLVRTTKNAVWVDTGGEVNTSVKQVLEAIQSINEG